MGLLLSLNLLANSNELHFPKASYLVFLKHSVHLGWRERKGIGLCHGALSKVGWPQPMYAPASLLHGDAEYKTTCLRLAPPKAHP